VRVNPDLGPDLAMAVDAGVTVWRYGNWCSVEVKTLNERAILITGIGQGSCVKASLPQA
jgi:hypothetical protein